jgi:hypothetical protein
MVVAVALIISLLIDRKIIAVVDVVLDDEYED